MKPKTIGIDNLRFCIGFGVANTTKHGVMIPLDLLTNERRLIYDLVHEFLHFAAMEEIMEFLIHQARKGKNYIEINRMLDEFIEPAIRWVLGYGEEVSPKVEDYMKALDRILERKLRKLKP